MSKGQNKAQRARNLSPSKSTAQPASLDPEPTPKDSESQTFSCQEAKSTPPAGAPMVLPTPISIPIPALETEPDGEESPTFGGIITNLRSMQAWITNQCRGLEGSEPDEACNHLNRAAALLETWAHAAGKE